MHLDHYTTTDPPPSPVIFGTLSLTLLRIKMSQTMDTSALHSAILDRFRDLHQHSHV